MLNSSITPADTSLPVLRESLAELVRLLHARGWTPATSSNFSCRAPEAGQNPDAFLVSASGLDKGAFSARDFLEVDMSGKPARPDEAHLKPSAETLLHALVYRLYPDARVILHTHSVNGTVLSKLYEREGGLWLKDFEILKGFEGVKTHETRIWLPVFPNAQDMRKLSAAIETELHRHQPVYGFLLAGHGLYTWGQTPAQAQRHTEVFEFLFEAILKLRSYGYADYSG